MTAKTSVPAETATRAGRAPAQPWRALLHRKLAVASLAYLLIVTVAAAAAPLLAPYGPAAVDFGHVLSGPSAAHWLGTDSLGRDILSRLIYGGRVSLVGVAEAVFTAVILGVPAGLVAGYSGGWADRVISWLIDLALAIPVIVTLLVVLAVVGSNETAAMISVGVLVSPVLARVVRAATLTVRRELYIAAARVAGIPDWRIIAGQVLPRIAGPVTVQVSLLAGAALMTETGLAYLGMGVQPPAATWGGMVADASSVVNQDPWFLLPPGVVIGLAILAFGLLGDAVRDVTSERTRNRVIGGGGRLVRRTGHQSSRCAHNRPPDLPSPRPGGPGTGAAGGTLLALRDVTIKLPGESGMTTVVDRVSLDISAGECVGLVGETGCGKSVTGSAVLGLLPGGGKVTEGQAFYSGTDLTALSPRSWREFRGSRIALISQDPQSSLDPVYPVGHQVAELVRRHHGLRRAQARKRTLELLSSVRLPDPAAVARLYPHQLSGGMAQRASIAMALAGEPELLIADEPTTALDVTVQAEILDLLRTLQQQNDMAIFLISHDWAVIAGLCQRAYVLYAGQVVESGAVSELMTGRGRHPYTSALLASSPRGAQHRTPLPVIGGAVPAPGQWPAGCHFHPRCPLAGPECISAPVPISGPVTGHRIRCVHHETLAKEGDDGCARTLA